MFLSNVFFSIKQISWLLAILLFIEPLAVLAKDSISESNSKNYPNFYIKDSKVYFEYILKDEKNAKKTYFVKILLKKESDEHYVYEPAFGGDVGRGISPSKNDSDIKIAVWTLNKEFDGDDYYFELDASPEQGFDARWIVEGVLIAGLATGLGFLINYIVQSRSTSSSSNTTRK